MNMLIGMIERLTHFFRLSIGDNKRQNLRKPMVSKVVYRLPKNYLKNFLKTFSVIWRG